MNSFICDTERPFSFMGRFNEDVNTYITHGETGEWGHVLDYGTGT